MDILLLLLMLNMLEKERERKESERQFVYQNILTSSTTLTTSGSSQCLLKMKK